MLGAIAGDVIGSIYEGRSKNVNTPAFPLFDGRGNRPSHFTDDSVLTVAVADSILHDAGYTGKLKEYFGYYPHGYGYGKGFKKWGYSEDPRPYNSQGNGSAMRVSPVGFAFDTEEEVLDQAKKSAEVTHNHPEGIRGAQVTAIAIFLARTGNSKEQIKEYVEEKFGYDLNESIESTRTWYSDERRIYCQESVPQGIRAFLEAGDFEETIRLAIYVGGDSDTIACIAGGIAQAYYNGVPGPIADEIIGRLDERLKGVTIEFMDKYCKGWRQ